MAKVSVIIPAYNQADYLGVAIQSILDQTYQDFEVIVVDDGSTDGTAVVVKNMPDDRIGYIYQENRGLSAARNTGIQNSTAPYLTFLDSDDLFLPEKLELLVNVLDKNPAVGLVAGQAIPVDENGKRIGEIFITPLPEEPSELLLHNPIHVGSVMIRREWQQKVGLFDETLRSYEDWDMWLRLLRVNCQTAWVPVPVSLYRFHQAQMTRIGDQMTRSTFAVLDKIFSDPNLPESWRSMRDEAYSSANLRAAAQAYHKGDIPRAKQYLDEAIHLNPELLKDDGDQLANHFRRWIDLPKTNDPLGYLNRIYHNLPDALKMLRNRHKKYLGNAAIQMAFSAYQQKDYKKTKYALIRAFLYQPKLLFHRGSLVVLFNSTFHA